MRSWTPSLASSLAAVLATGLSLGPALSEEEAHSSVRDCMRSVTKLERQVKDEDGSTRLADRRLFNRARDLCMQTRYEMVMDMLGAVRLMDGS